MFAQVKWHESRNQFCLDGSFHRSMGDGRQFLTQLELAQRSWYHEDNHPVLQQSQVLWEPFQLLQWVRLSRDWWVWSLRESSWGYDRSQTPTRQEWCDEQAVKAEPTAHKDSILGAILWSTSSNEPRKLGCNGSNCCHSGGCPRSWRRNSAGWCLLNADQTLLHKARSSASIPILRKDEEEEDLSAQVSGC